MTKQHREHLQQLRAEEFAFETLDAAFSTLMLREAWSKTAIARRLGIPESHVRRMVNGRNFTVRSLARILHRLGYRLHIQFKKVEVE